MTFFLLHLHLSTHKNIITLTYLSTNLPTYLAIYLSIHLSVLILIVYFIYRIHLDYS